MNKKINIFFFCVFFYTLFPILFRGISSYQQMLLYAISLITVLLNFNKIKQYNFNKYIILSGFAYVIIVIASIIFPLIYGTMDFTYLKKILDIFFYSLKFLFLICLFINIHGKSADKELFLKYFIYSCCLLVITTMIFILFPNIKMIWSGLIYNSQNNIANLQQQKYISRYSVIGFTGFRQTFMCVLSFVFSVFLILKDETNKRSNMIRLTVMILLSILGTVFYGRIGTLTIFIITIFFIPETIKNKRVLKIFGLSFIILFVVIIFLTILKEYNNTIKVWYNWAFAIIINFFKGNKIGDGSTDVLLKMYVMPNIRTFLLGDAKYTTEVGKYYMNTDVGFIRPILFYGIFLTIIGYSILVYIYLSTKSKILNEENNKIDKKMILTLLISTLIFELKGEIYQYIIPILLCISFLIGFEQNICKNEGELDVSK